MGLPPGEGTPGSVAATDALAEDWPAEAARPGGSAEPGGPAGSAEAAEPGGAAASAGAVTPAGMAQRGSGTGPAGATVRGAGPGGVAVRARPPTGDARVDEAVARLDGLAALPVAEHLAVFEYVHERLTEALGDLDVHAPARSGEQPPGHDAPGG